MPRFTISSPYDHHGSYRCRLSIAGRKIWCPVEDTPEGATRLAEQCARELTQGEELTVSGALEKYLDFQSAKGNRPTSLDNNRTVLQRFFGGALERPLSWVNASRAQELYEELRRRPGPRGRVPAVDTHRNYLAQARSFLQWAQGQRLVKANPLGAVVGVGRRSKGKKQLRIDEARQLRAHCLELAPFDDGALAALMALLLAMRASEIITRTVRDVDDGGRKIWVDHHEESGFRTKTAAGRRLLDVPEELQPLLLNRIAGRRPGELLFPAEGGGRHWRDWPTEQVRRLCAEAGVPLVCAHALRGQHATLAIQAGASPLLVAAALGHESPSTTLGAYAAPGSAQHATQNRVTDLLRQRRERPGSEKCPQRVPKPEKKNPRR